MLTRHPHPRPRRARTVVAVLLAVACLTSCGSSNQGEQGDPSGGGPVRSAAAPVPAKTLDALRRTDVQVEVAKAGTSAAVDGAAALAVARREFPSASGTAGKVTQTLAYLTTSDQGPHAMRPLTHALLWVVAFLDVPVPGGTSTVVAFVSTDQPARLRQGRTF